MKKLAKFAAGACAASMALTVAGCASSEQPPSESSEVTSPAFDPSENIPVAIYGPPEMLDSSPAFDPASNQNEDVYGPPEMFGTMEGSAETGADTANAAEGASSGGAGTGNAK